MSLLELIVAFLIFGLVMLGIAQTMGTTLSLTRTNRHRSVAANLASEEMDTIRSMEFDQIVDATTTVPVDTIKYVVVRTTTLIDKAATGGPCSVANPNPKVLRVHVSVTWGAMSGIPPVVSDTTITPPVGAFSPNTGHIAVKVTDRDGTPTQFVTVQTTGPQNLTKLTDVDGCAFFGFLGAGVYSVKMNQPGYVDDKMNPVPAIAATVVATKTVSKSFQYDQAVRIDVTMAGGAAVPVPVDLPVTVWSNNSKHVVINGTGAVRSINGLFPFSAGYYAWAGACADADPEGDNIGDDGSGGQINLGKFWTGATRGALMSVEPGATVPATLGLHDAVVSVVNVALAPQIGVTVIATHLPDYLCGGETHNLGVTGALGSLSVALPYGTWKLTVVGKSAPGGVWPTTTLDPRDLTPTNTTVTVL